MTALRQLMARGCEETVCLRLFGVWLGNGDRTGQGDRYAREETEVSESRIEDRAETLAEVGARLSRETASAYEASGYGSLSRDYFGRFVCDEAARPAKGEIEIGGGWQILLSPSAAPLTELMAGDLAQFLEQSMGVSIPVETGRDKGTRAENQVVLSDWEGGVPDLPGSFTVDVGRHAVRVSGRDPEGLRDGVVKLVDALGMRRAPILEIGRSVYRPRLGVRLGAVPFQGSYRDVVFLGYNAVFAGGGDLYALSRSAAIPALEDRQAPLPPPPVEARRYGLKTYAFVNTRQKFPAGHPVFRDHPEIRGALTWSADGEYTLCTEQPLVRQYLQESVEGIFASDPDLDGLVLIVGGEGFYHCFMRPHNAEKGHTNCERCERVGPEKVVANLCNLLAEAVQRVNPTAEVIAWPYSAEHVWSRDRAQIGMMNQMKPGTGIFTEIEKDEYVEKPDAVSKHLWDYSIDLIGPGRRAQDQIDACRERGLSIYLKSEPELGFEAARLPHLPCMDRWAARAEALAACGADGAWVFPAFRPLYGTCAAEINKHFWWDPVPQAERVLQDLAARIAGPEAGPHLRRAWQEVSVAVEWSPELPPYYTGPTYLGPAHPMCADPDAELPEVFYGLYLFRAEAQDAEGLKKHPTFFTEARGDVEVFERFYRTMEGHLRQAVAELDAAADRVPESHQLIYGAETSSIRWFYHTARTTANFHESCRLRDGLLSPARGESSRGGDAGDTLEDWEQWAQVLEDERDNTEAAVPVAEADMRLDFYYGSDHTFPHLAEMLAAKLEIIDGELEEFLPSVGERLGLV